MFDNVVAMKGKGNNWQTDVPFPSPRVSAINATIAKQSVRDMLPVSVM